MPILEELLVKGTPSAHEINQHVRQRENRARRDLTYRLVQIREAHEAELASLPAHETKQGDGRVEEVRPQRNRSRCGAILCGLGIHGGKWEYVTDGDCGQVRVCRRCGDAKERIKHRFEWRYVNDGACRQVKVCGRCVASKDNRTRHEAWSDSWEVGRDRSAHRCQRCGVVETWDTGAGD